MSGMSKEILFLRGIDEDSDPLDDSVLLDSYDKHFNNLKKKALRRMGYTNSEIDDVLKVSSTQKKKKSPKPPAKWSVGSHCRSVFSEDGKVYEATIVEIFPEEETCRVQYVGYNNDEVVAVSSLAPSRGRKARGAQTLAATGSTLPETELLENCSEEESVPGEANAPHQKGKLPRNGKKKWSPHSSNMTLPQMPQLNGLSMPQLNGISPGMPSVVPPMPFNIMESNSEQAEAFSAMLMSWYMSGYYTGYYEAMNVRRRPNGKK